MIRIEANLLHFPSRSRGLHNAIEPFGQSCSATLKSKSQSGRLPSGWASVADPLPLGPPSVGNPRLLLLWIHSSFRMAYALAFQIRWRKQSNPEPLPLTDWPDDSSALQIAIGRICSRKLAELGTSSYTLVTLQSGFDSWNEKWSNWVVFEEERIP